MHSAVVFTVGHSDRATDALLALLESHRIRALVDVRAQPHSGRFPRFSGGALRQTLDQAGIQYHWAGRQLGGRRQAIGHSKHTSLDAGLRGYADYMESETFQRAALQLLRMADTTCTVLLCAERLPERCHRRLIADYLSLQGVTVIHLIDAGEVREHVLSPELRRESLSLVYDRNSSGEMKL
jgi:uncharacterized protein (DUF488 family)